jgi:hypothetical protein
MCNLFTLQTYDRLRCIFKGITILQQDQSELDINNSMYCAILSSSIQQHPTLSLLKSPPMLRLRLIKKPNFLSESNTSNNNFMIFYRNPMPSTSNAMINIEYHTIFRWEIRYGYIFKKSTSQDPLEAMPNLIWALHHHQGYG